MMTPFEIYNAYENSHMIDDASLVYGTQFFRDLAKMNTKCGPIFELATKEAWRMHEALLHFVRARGLAGQIPEEV